MSQDTVRTPSYERSASHLSTSLGTDHMALFVEFARVVFGDNAIAIDVVCL